MFFISFLFLFCFLIQLFFILCIFTLILRYKSAKKKPSIYQPSISVIVCAYNEYRNLQKLIPALLDQDYPCFEIIIADDCSNDHTQSYLEELSLKSPYLQYLRIQETPPLWNRKKYALYRAIQIAGNEIILLTDADCIPESNVWIQLMADQFEADTDFVLGVSPYIKEKGFLNALIQYETFLTALQYLSLTLAGLPYMGVGRNMAYRKKMVVENQGKLEKYSSLTGGDDDLLVNQLANSKNTKICIEKKSQVNSVPKNTWHSWIRQKHRHLGAGNYYRTRHKLILGIFNFSQIFFYVSFFIFVVGTFFLENQNDIILFFVLYLVRLFIFVTIYAMVIQRLGLKIHTRNLIILDFVYSIYLLVVGILAISIKKTQWD